MFLFDIICNLTYICHSTVKGKGNILIATWNNVLAMVMVLAKLLILKKTKTIEHAKWYNEYLKTIFSQNFTMRETTCFNLISEPCHISYFRNGFPMLKVKGKSLGYGKCRKDFFFAATRMGLTIQGVLPSPQDLTVA